VSLDGSSARQRPSKLAWPGPFSSSVRAPLWRSRLALLAWQSYEVRDHVASGDTVVTRMRWSAELAADAGPWPAGTRMSAWCVAHYRLVAGRIVRIEQHDCYEQPLPPEARAADRP
jgi:SnoaL-like domain